MTLTRTPEVLSKLRARSAAAEVEEAARVARATVKMHHLEVGQFVQIHGLLGRPYY